VGLFKKWDAYFQFDSLRVLHNFGNISSFQFLCFYLFVRFFFFNFVGSCLFVGLRRKFFFLIYGFFFFFFF
jgi:hypothetical protein